MLERDKMDSIQARKCLLCSSVKEKLKLRVAGELGPMEQSRTESFVLSRFMKKTRCFLVVLSNAWIGRDVGFPETVQTPGLLSKRVPFSLEACTSQTY